ncbi:holo-[acyl-carrier protein] synthase [Humidesulfovibrio mexicanus]|uniref:Holo-[acyl-carrier-protein] synthase n=1 Tax=Humidesulfovibrio mexicanus TaxID=147047 RepID=A0A238Z7C8_9BACT|nr:holo-ACP synthase [Humidesulfovibrio mexicanus]SNR79140.1 holo-[acyl-carrier protein] synthase [Humidesulfovibrio mexicanus]
MILGLGLDVAEVERIRNSLARFGARFVGRVLTAAEAEAMPKSNAEYYVAARFAAKEACAKALGTGFSRGVTLHSIGVAALPSGAPRLVLTGRARELALEMGVRAAHVSLTHERGIAAAVVILEGPDTTSGQPEI